MSGLNFEVFLPTNGDNKNKSDNALKVINPHSLVGKNNENFFKDYIDELYNFIIEFDKPTTVGLVHCLNSVYILECYLIKKLHFIEYGNYIISSYNQKASVRIESLKMKAEQGNHSNINILMKHPSMIKFVKFVNERKSESSPFNIRNIRNDLVHINFEKFKLKHIRGEKILNDAKDQAEVMYSIIIYINTFIDLTNKLNTTKETLIKFSKEQLNNNLIAELNNNLISALHTALDATINEQNIMTLNSNLYLVDSIASISKSLSNYNSNMIKSTTSSINALIKGIESMLNYNNDEDI